MRLDINGWTDRINLIRIIKYISDTRLGSGL